MFTRQNSEVWQCLSANAYPLVWHFFDFFCNEKNPCLIRDLAGLGYFAVAFCQHLPIGRYGQRKKQYIFCTALHLLANL